MKPRPSKVIAVYLGNGEEDLPKSWMEDLEDKTEEPSQNDVRVVNDLLSKGILESDSEQIGRDMNHGGDYGQSLINDIPDAKSRGKQQQAPTPNHNDQSVPFDSQPFWNNKSVIYDESPEDGQGVLHQWWKAKEHPDDTTGTVWMPTDLNWGKNSSIPLFPLSKEAATIQQISDGNRHRKKQEIDTKARSVNVRKVSSDDQERKGLYVFKANSPGSSQDHTTVLQFLKDKSPNPTNKKLVDHDVLIGCTCPAFLFWGSQYYAVREHYMYMDMFRPSFVEPGQYKPGEKNPKRGGGATYCKHVKALFDNIGQLGIDESYNEALEEKIIRVTDPELYRPDFDASEWVMDHGIETREKLRDLIRSRKVSPELQKEVDDLLRSAGAGNHTLENFMNTTWKEWSEQGSVGEKRKELAIRKMVQVPAAILWILIRDFKETGVFNQQLFSAGYQTLDKVFSFRNIKDSGEEKP